MLASETEHLTNKEANIIQINAKADTRKHHQIIQPTQGFPVQLMLTSQPHSLRSGYDSLCSALLLTRAHLDLIP